MLAISRKSLFVKSLCRFTWTLRSSPFGMRIVGPLVIPLYARRQNRRPSISTSLGPKRSSYAPSAPGWSSGGSSYVDVVCGVVLAPFEHQANLLHAGRKAASRRQTAGVLEGPGVTKVEQGDQVKTQRQ